MIEKNLRWFYLILLFTFYAYIEYLFQKSGNKEAGISLVVIMGVLTCPMGLLIPIFFSFVGVYIELDKLIPSNEIFMFITWLTMSILGYLQWFILLPKVFKKLKSEKSPKVWGMAIVGLVVILYGLYRFYIHVFPGRI